MLTGTKLLTFHRCVVSEQTCKSSGRLHHVNWYIVTNIVECSVPRDISNYLPVNSIMRMPDLICSQYLAKTCAVTIPQIPLTLFSHLKALKHV